MFTRLADDGTNIAKHAGPVLNSKTEWHQPKIIRNVIIQGGVEVAGDNMGWRPYIPTLAPGPEISVVTSLEELETSRSMRSMQRAEWNMGI